jgi:predicted dehydrogenase/nucleoside-diphosphate-sugar epimerase
MDYVILGGGAVTAEFYLPALTLLGLIERTTVVDPFDSSLAVIRAQFPTARLIVQSHLDFLASLAPGGEERVIVALPNALHVEAVEAALAARRHVLCEKPLALAAGECARLVQAAAAAHRKLKVAMSRRYLASLMLARQMVRAGELGAVQSVEVQDCSPFLWKPRSFSFFAAEAGGVLADMGVHYLDFLDTIVGPLAPLAYEDDARGGTESSAAYSLAAGDIPVSLRLSRIDPAGAFIRIVCERGEILVDKAVENAVTVTPTGAPARFVAVEHPFDEPAWPPGFKGSFCQMLRDFEGAIAGAQTPIADASDAERAAALIEWAYAHRPTWPVKAAAERPSVVVTGATGFIGGHLVERLTQASEAKVKVTVRTPASCANVSRFPIELAPTDLLDPDSVKASLAGARTVYHLAYGKEGDAARITVEGTKAVVEAAIAAGVDCVVVLSTMYVFGFPPGGQPIDESFPYRPYGGEYGTSKAAMERWCLERAKTSGATRIVVINPTCVFGPAGGAYTALPVDLAREGRFCWISDGVGSCNYTYVENVVDALIAAAAEPAAHGERFIINDGVTSWRAFFEPLLAPLGQDIPSCTPQELARLPRFGGPFSWRELAAAAISSERVRNAAKRSALVRRLFDRMTQTAARKGQAEHAFSYRPAHDNDADPVFPPEWLAELYSPAKATFSADKARRVLGWAPRLALAEAQDETIVWLRQSGRLPNLSAP